MLVATHNVMQGLFLRHLLPAYSRLHRRRRLGLLCLQECSPSSAALILRALGARFRVLSHPAAQDLAIVYDSKRLLARSARPLALPRLARVPLWQHVYTSATPQQCWALLANFKLRRKYGRRRQLIVANFHLDAAGDISHRERQARALSCAVPVRPSNNLLACGDTNAFTWRASEAEPALSQVLRPILTRHLAHDSKAGRCAVTHFMSRAREPKLGHQIAVLAGRFGIDFPRRYDVICASPAVAESGVIDTPASDHNLVWGDLRL